MQKKIIALAVAGLSTAAFAQTNVTIYGVADVSAQGYNMGSHTARAKTDAPDDGRVAQGGAFGMTNNSSLIGFKGTEDLGNGLKALFQVETNVSITGNNGNGGNVAGTTNSGFGSARDSYVGLNSKYGTVLGGYLSTPYRSALTSFDVMPGATGSGRIENLVGNLRWNNQNTAAATALDNGVNTGGMAVGQSVRSTALAYVMPTMYGFTGALAYTGSNRNGWGNEGAATAPSATSVTTVAPQSAISLNLGWEGYGIGIKGAYQQAKVNYAQDFNTTGGVNNLQGATSYLVGAQYTGVPGLKVAAVYNRNTVGVNGTPVNGAMKGSNNQVWVGASYRFGNNEPRLSFASTGNTNGIEGVGQDGARQWTANWGYYLSKRTQVYGLVSGLGNNANGIYTMAGNGTNLLPTGGQRTVTYGAGLRTNF